MSGEGKPPAASRSRSSALPRLYAADRPFVAVSGARNLVRDCGSLAISTNAKPCLATTYLTWHEQIGDPTLADGILDRLVHNALRCVAIRCARTAERPEGSLSLPYNCA